MFTRCFKMFTSKNQKIIANTYFAIKKCHKKPALQDDALIPIYYRGNGDYAQY